MEKIYGIKIVTAREWGAKPAKGIPLKTIPDKIIIHHMATPNPPRHISKDDPYEIAKKCQDWHFKNGWIDTGQHFTISCNGTILEGRQGSTDALKAGKCLQAAHCKGEDQNYTWGIELEGEHRFKYITQEQEKSLVDLCAVICRKSSIQSNELYGHCDFDPVNKPYCPGKTVMDKLNELKGMVYKRILTL